jgi:hypothetical protein
MRKFCKILSLLCTLFFINNANASPNQSARDDLYTNSYHIAADRDRIDNEEHKNPSRSCSDKSEAYKQDEMYGILLGLAIGLSIALSLKLISYFSA